MSFDPKLYKMFARRKLNVLLRGKHGVGKTALIKEVFNELYGEVNKDWLYLSASTLDPWVDLIGVPKNYTREDGVEVFKIIPPENFAEGTNIKAIFVDEINRGEPKTLNALMELLQFKTLQGRPFPKLELVWAAENPAEDGVYMVQPMDPAQKDRFPIQIDVPYILNLDYFKKKYGDDATKVAQNWWQKNKELISPRKLDDMMSGWKEGIELRWFSNECKRINELQHGLSSLSFVQSARDVIDSKDDDNIRSFFTMDVLRKNAKILMDYGDILASIYEHVDGESQEMICNQMGFVPPAKIDQDVYLNANYKNVKKIVDKEATVLFNDRFNGLGERYIRDAANRAQSIFGRLLKDDANSYIEMEKIILALGRDDVLRTIFKNVADIHIFSSGCFSEITRNLKPSGAEALKNLGRIVAITLRNTPNRISSETVFAYDFLKKFNGSSLMSKALVRVPQRSKRVVETMDAPVATPMSFMWSDYQKMYK